MSKKMESIGMKEEIIVVNGRKLNKLCEEVEYKIETLIDGVKV